MRAPGGIRAGAHPVVQIKQHRRALGRRYQQILKFAQGQRPDRVAVVGSGQPTVGAFGGVNVEVIAPEIDHDFIELAVTVKRAQEFALLQFKDHDARAFHGLHGHVAWLSLRPRRWIEFDQFAAVKPHGLEPGDLFVGRVIGDLFRRELLVQVGSDADARGSLHVAQGGTETGAIQKMDDLFGLG